MADKVLKLTVAEEKSLLMVGRHEGWCTNENGLSLRVLECLRTKGLVFSGDVKDDSTGRVDKRGWFLTSNGFFIYKQLSRGKSFHRQQKGAKERK